MRCRFCGLHCTEGHAPRTWKICGGVALCRECWRTRCRVRSITAAVAEPVGAAWREFSAVLENEAQPLLIRDRERIEIASLDNHPVVRVFLADRWWTLRLNSYGWSAGRRTDYSQMLAGEILALEVLLYRGMARGPCPANGFVRNRRSDEAIACRIVAWLPGRRRPEVRRFDSDIPPRQDIASMELNKLRRAIRSNRVSFPAQVPAFPGGAHDTDVQRRAAQLYFVLGWSCAGIAARYNLLPREVRRMVSVWKQRAANAGYIQRIPPSNAIGQPAAGDASPSGPGSGAGADLASDDAPLISGLRAGDPAAYDRLLARYQDPVYNLASRLLCDRANADDATQAVFLTAFRSVRGLCGIASLRTWLYRFVVTECLKRCPAQTLASASAPGVPIEKALLEIDPVLRIAVVLRELENLRYEEIAEILQLPLTTVRYRIELGRDLLRQNPITSAIATMAVHPVI